MDASLVNFSRSLTTESVDVTAHFLSPFLVDVLDFALLSLVDSSFAKNLLLSVDTMEIAISLCH